MTKRGILSRLPSAYARRMAKWFGRRMYTLPSRGPIITFTFDDFPRTALSAGGAILQQLGSAGTYFLSFGLMRTITPTGEIFHPEDFEQLVAAGHEAACHTFHHCPAWETSTRVYESSVGENAATLKEMAPGLRFDSHSYPISYPRPRTKRRLATRFRASRGAGQTFNHGSVDLNYLKSFFLEQSRDNFNAVEHAIAANARAGGWLIFSTHDICDHPTRFGCTPTFLEKTVRASIASGAKIQLMSTALDSYGVPRTR